MILPLLMMALASDDTALAAASASCSLAHAVPASNSTPEDQAAPTAGQIVMVSNSALKPDESELRRARLLRHLDAVRQAAGASALLRSNELELSASSHAAYLSGNGFRSAPSAHAEAAGMPGFTGADPFDRMRAAGYRLSYATEVIGDIGSVAVDTDCLDHLMNTIYHAALLLSRVAEAGAAYGTGRGAGMCTIDLGAPLASPGGQTPASGEIIRYPAPGMAMAGGSFLVGSENPRPPPSLLPNANVGIPVLVGLRNADFLAAAPGSGVEIQHFELGDANGLPVPSVVLADTAITGAGVIADVGLHGVFAALVPRVPLAPGRYLVTLHATIAGTHVIAPPPWSFSVLAP